MAQNLIDTKASNCFYVDEDAVWVSRSGGEPEKVNIDSNVVCVADYFTHTLFVTDDGKVYGVGSNRFGQLGTEKLFGVKGAKIEDPVEVATNIKGKVVQVATGYYHSLFLTDKGEVYACGSNKNGGLGQGTFGGDIAEPVLVGGAIANKKVVKVAVGSSLYSLFLTDEGKVYACGKQAAGGCGLGNIYRLNRATPTLIPHTIGDRKIVDVSAGDAHSLFVANDGSLYACGENAGHRFSFALLDVGDPYDGFFPIDHSLVDGEWVPFELPQGEKFVKVFASDFMSFFLTNKGSVYGCGAAFKDVPVSTWDDNVEGADTIACFTAIKELEGKNVVSVAPAFNTAVFFTDDGELIPWSVNKGGNK